MIRKWGIGRKAEGQVEVIRNDPPIKSDPKERFTPEYYTNFTSAFRRLDTFSEFLIEIVIKFSYFREFSLAFEQQQMTKCHLCLKKDKCVILFYLIFSFAMKQSISYVFI